MSDGSRTIAVVTTTRADYSYYRPVLARILACPDLRLRLIVTGMHLSERFGSTVHAIQKDAFPVADRIEMLLEGDTPAAIAKSMGVGVLGMAEALGRERPHILLVLGDRFEMLATAVAALPFAIPIAHVGGGESTEGAMDDAARHAITKMSHLHFVQAPPYRDRVIQMGEEPWRVVLAGAASLDNLQQMTLLTREELEQRFRIDLTRPPLVVTFHPATLEADRTAQHVRELLAALDVVNEPLVFTGTNADTSHRSVTAAIQEYVAAREDARLVTNLGTHGYFSLLNAAKAMVGNSSSGIIEAATFKLPVVNVGSRQAGRIHDRNVIDVECTRDKIAAAIRQATSASFRASLEGLRNPYSNGGAGDIIVETLRTCPLGPKLLMKRFHEAARG